ncbi:hypothetical protein KJ969_03240 [Patescibacteria group bacterium]|nr:hypothetical protein [Patescibacteria group bacterium]MBU1922238.1 hypothetical protein [Patescibacteria group bacterium]
MYDITPEDLLKHGRQLNIDLDGWSFEAIQSKLEYGEVLFAFYYITDPVRYGTHFERENFKNTISIMAPADLALYVTTQKNTRFLRHGDYFAVPKDKCLELHRQQSTA